MDLNAAPVLEHGQGQQLESIAPVLIPKPLTLATWLKWAPLEANPLKQNPLKQNPLVPLSPALDILTP